MLIARDKGDNQFHSSVKVMLHLYMYLTNSVHVYVSTYVDTSDKYKNLTEDADSAIKTDFTNTDSRSKGDNQFYRTCITLLMILHK